MSNIPVLTTGKLAVAFVGVLSLIMCLTVIGFSTVKISATEFRGSVQVQNTSPFDVSILYGNAFVVDAAGNLVATCSIENAPLTLKPQEVATIEVPVKMMDSLENYGLVYSPSDVFTVKGFIKYRIGFVTSEAKVVFSLTEADALNYAHMFS